MRDRRVHRISTYSLRKLLDQLEQELTAREKSAPVKITDDPVLAVAVIFHAIGPELVTLLERGIWVDRDSNSARRAIKAYADRFVQEIAPGRHEE